jgi:hypothetical protein
MNFKNIILISALMFNFKKSYAGEKVINGVSFEIGRTGQSVDVVPTQPSVVLESKLVLTKDITEASLKRCSAIYSSFTNAFNLHSKCMAGDQIACVAAKRETFLVVAKIDDFKEGRAYFELAGSSSQSSVSKQQVASSLGVNVDSIRIFDDLMIEETPFPIRIETRKDSLTELLKQYAPAFVGGELGVPTSAKHGHLYVDSFDAICDLAFNKASVVVGYKASFKRRSAIISLLNESDVWNYYIQLKKNIPDTSVSEFELGVAIGLTTRSFAHNLQFKDAYFLAQSARNELFESGQLTGAVDGPELLLKIRDKAEASQVRSYETPAQINPNLTSGL